MIKENTKVAAYCDKIWIVTLLFILIALPLTSAFEFDNIKTYDSINKEVTIKNSFGLGGDIAKVKLLTDLNVYAIPSKDSLVAELEFDSSDDYIDALKSMEFIDVKTGQPLQRTFTFKQKSVRTESYELERAINCKPSGTGKNRIDNCEHEKYMQNRDIIDWTPLNSKDMKKGKIIIGIFADVEENDYVEWIPTFYGQRIDEWATWTSSLNTALRAYWKMNETSGSKIDSTGKYNITLSGGVLSSPNGKINASSQGDDANRGTLGGVISNATEITFVFWVNRTSFTTGERFWGSNSQNFDFQAQNCAQVADGWCPVFNNIGGTNTQALADSNWHFLAMVAKSGDRAEYYVDNVLKANNSAGSFTDINDNLFLMAYDGTDTSSGAIYIDEAAVWNRSLTGAELTQLYNSGSAITYNPNPLEITNCQSINVSGTYTVMNNIQSSGTCLSINANNVTIDGGGFTINYSMTGLGYGINVSHRQSYTISNLNILQNGTLGSTINSAYAIYLNNASYGNINTNTIKTKGAINEYGVYLTGTNSTRVIANNIIVNGTADNNYGIYLVSSRDNIISNNNISAYGTNSNIGINLQTSNFNIISFNNATGNGTTTGNNGIFLSTSTNNNVSSNILNTGGTSTNYGLVLNSASNNNILNRNNITTFGTSSNFGIYMVSTSTDNTITNNFVATHGSANQNHGIYLLTTVNNNNITGNDIIINGTNLMDGIRFESTALNNIISYNRIRSETTGTGTAGAGIRLTTTAHNNSIFNNNVSGNPTAISLYGVYVLSTANNNTITNNNLSVNGGGSAGDNKGIWITSTSHGNIINNNFIVAGGASSGPGIYISSTANNNIVNNNTIFTTGGGNDNYGIIFITQANNNTASNNYIYTGGGTRDFGIHLTSNADNNTIINNTIITNSTSSGNLNRGIYLFTTTRNNILSGNNITTNGNNNDYGIVLETAVTNTTVFNNIVKTTALTGGSNYGIYLTDTANGNNISSNNITTTGTTNDYGIYLLSTALNNNLNNNNISSNGTGDSNHGIILQTTANNNNVTNNFIVARGSSVNNFGIAITTSVNNNILMGNAVYTAGLSANNYGVVFSSNSFNNSLINNSIFTKGTGSNYGVHLLSTAHNNTIINNTINTTGSTNANFGIYGSTTIFGNIITGNIINTNGTDSNIGIYLQTTANNNTVSFNVINARGTTSDNYGIDLNSAATQNVISNNNITATGTSQNYGLFVNTNVNNNTFSNNQISSTGTTTSNFVVYIVASSNNTFIGNVLNNTRGDAFRLETLPLKNTTIINNSIIGLNLSTWDLNIVTTGINDTSIIDSRIRNFSITNGTLYIKNSSYGEIKYQQSVSGITGNLIGNSTSIILIKNNSVDVNTNLLGGFNRSSNITFYNLPTTFITPVIYKNDVLCPAGSCTALTSLNAGTVLINVSSFTNYTIFDTSTLVNQSDINSCRNITGSNANYWFSQNVTPTYANCIVVTASNITIDGNGYTISNSSFNATAIKANSSTNITIKNLKIAGLDNLGLGTTTGIGILMDNVINSVIYNSTFDSIYGYGLFINNSDNNVFTNISSTSNTLAGLNMILSDNNSISSFYAYGSPNYGFFVTDGVQNIFNNISGYGNNGIGMWMDRVNNSIINNSNFTLNILENMYLNNSYLNNITNSSFVLGDDDGISLEKSHNNTLDRLIIIENVAGINALSGQNIIKNSIFTGNVQRGILLDSASDGNYITNVTITNGSLYGIDLLSASTNNQIVNLIANNQPTSIRDRNAGGNNYLIFNNSDGEIKFLNQNNITVQQNISLSQNGISNNNIGFITDNLKDLNVSANITFRGLNAVPNPTIQKDGVSCVAPQCNAFTSLNAGTVLINVTSWSNYSIGSIAGLVSQWHFENNDTIGLSDVFGFNNLSRNGRVIQNFTCIQGNCTKSLNDLGVNKINIITTNLISSPNMPLSVGYWFRIDNITQPAIIEGRADTNFVNIEVESVTNQNIDGVFQNSNWNNATFFLSEGWHLYTLTLNSSGTDVWIDAKKVAKTTHVLGDGAGSNTDWLGGWWTGGVYLNNITLDEGFYYNKVLNDSEISIIYNNVTSTLSSNVTIRNPLNGTTITSFNEFVNVSFNVSVANNPLSTCFYSNESNNISITCGNNATIQFYHPQANRSGYHTLIYYLNNLGTIFSNSTMFLVNNIGAVENNASWSNITSEGAVESFISSVTAPANETFSINLVYKNVSYSGLATGTGSGNYTFSKTIIIPSGVGNNSWNWQINYASGFQQNLTQHIQLVQKLNVDNCTTFGTLIYNFTLRDEDGRTLMPGTIELLVNFSNPQRSATAKVFNQSYTVAAGVPAQICWDPINSTYSVDYQAKYYSNSTYDIEYKFAQSITLVNTSGVQNINLYPLLESRATPYKIIVTSSDLSEINGAVIDVQRQYIPINQFISVESPITDETGTTTAQLVSKEIYYNFVVTRNGQLLGTFNNYLVQCQNEATGDCRIYLNIIEATSTLPNFEQYGNISTNFLWNPDTRALTIDFLTIDGANHNITWNVIQANNYLNNTICGNSAVASIGTFLCNVPLAYGNSSVLAKVYSDGTYLGFAQFSFDASPDEIWGGTKIILGILMYGTIALLFIGNPAMMIIGAMLGMLFAMGFHFVDGGTLFGNGAIVLWFLTAGAVILNYLRNKT